MVFHILSLMTSSLRAVYFPSAHESLARRSHLYVNRSSEGMSRRDADGRTPRMFAVSGLEQSEPQSPNGKVVLVGAWHTSSGAQ